MKHVYMILLGVILFSTNLFPQNSRPMNLTLDYSRFKMNNENSYIEFYYAYSPFDMKKKDIGGKPCTELLLRFTIIDTITKEVNIDKMWNLRNEFSDSISEKYLIGQSRFLLEYAPYVVKVLAMDINNPSMIDSVIFPINILKYENNDIEMSDIEFCSSIKQIEKDTNNIFYKNTYEVKPNPFNIIDIKYPVLGYYSEIYNLKTKNIGNKIVAKYRIFDNSGKEYLSKSITKQIKDGTSVEAGIVNVGKLKGGAFNFTYTISDSMGKVLGENTKRFFVYDQNVKPQTPERNESVSADEYVLMTEKDIDALSKQAAPIAKDEEKSQYKKLNGLEAKRNFMRHFWGKREDDEFNNKKVYLERVKYCESRFRTKWNDGCSSDRGRVCLVYGIPEESYTERGKETEKGKPYEIWFYPGLLSGTYFIFVDESGFNNFRLVHSTHPNEVHDDEWKSFLQNR